MNRQELFRQAPKKIFYLGMFAAACYVNPLLGLGFIGVILLPSLTSTGNGGLH
ncbi:MAG: hypothetical protein KC609_10330 [Myxococcales bacterium]|nr:hypothetical protein [Myxococcales bacterium]